MAHIQIKAPNPDRGSGQLIVDGVDISDAVVRAARVAEEDDLL